MKVLVCVLVIAGLCSLASCYPTHASCKLTWTFSMDCSSVFNSLIAQMNKWNMSAKCGTDNNSEKCLYTIKSKTGISMIEATHTTPKKHYVDDVTFNLNATSSFGCIVKGYSTSETWYAVLDYGTNYCNMRNLADGSGLSQSSGFKEETSDSICTQYSSHDCDKY